MTSFVPPDGRITSLSSLAAPLSGSEVMEIVSPGNASTGNNYQVTTAVIAAFCASFPALNTEVIKAGATLASPYMVAATDTVILFNKTLASASYATCPAASSMLYGQDILFKDIKGDAYTNNITIQFSGSEKCDGLTTLAIDTNYGFVRVTPIPGGGGWYQT
jgi:hypothetical protein